MKTTKYTNYNTKQEVITELLGQLIRGGGRSGGRSSNDLSRRSGGGGGSGRGRGSGGGSSGGVRSGALSSSRGSIRRPVVTRRPVPGLTRRGNPKPVTAQQAKTSGSAANTSVAQKRKPSETVGGTGPKKTATEGEKDVTSNGTKDTAKEKDPYIRGLSEIGLIWYKRFLKEGLEPKAACKKAWEQYTEPTDYEPQWGKEFQLKALEEEIKFKQRVLSRNSKKTDVAEDYRIAVYPKDFPDQMLDLQTLVSLEKAIIAEVAKGAGGDDDKKLQFLYAHLRPGALLVDCANPETANWLKEVGSKLATWTGPAITASEERSMPDAYVMTVALPKSQGQEFERTLALITAQNDDLNTEVWKLVNERDDDEKQVVTIRVDKDSFNTIKRWGYKLYYRFEKVPVHFHCYLRFDSPALWITNPTCYKLNQVRPPGPPTTTTAK